VCDFRAIALPIPAQLVTPGLIANCLILLMWGRTSEGIGKPNLGLPARGKPLDFPSRVGVLFASLTLCDVPARAVHLVEPFEVGPKGIAQSRPGFCAISNVADQQA
jgi:hypothetical protein